MTLDIIIYIEQIIATFDFNWIINTSVHMDNIYDILEICHKIRVIEVILVKLKIKLEQLRNMK